MAEYTDHYGWIKLLAGEAFSTNDYQFVQADRESQDRLVHQGAENHVHTGAAPAFTTPGAASTLTLSTTGGFIPAGTRVYYKSTFVDASGNETGGSPEAYVDTAAAVSSPLAPALTLASTGGTLTAGNHYYALSAYKGANTQETKALNTAYITIPSGVTTGKITLTFPTAPTGADGFNVYRKKPGANDFRYITSVVVATTSLQDTNLTEDTSRTLPTGNTTNAANSVTVEVAPTVEQLATDAQGFETADGGWTGLTNSTVARSTLHAYAGTASLELTASSAATMRAVSPTGLSGGVIAATQVALGSFRVKPGTTARNVNAVLRWYNGASFLSETVGTAVLETSGTFVEVTVRGAAPATATRVALAAQVVSPGNAEKHYVDAASIKVASVPTGATWRLYRSYTGDYTNSLLHWVVEETVPGTVDRTYVDTGIATTSGRPPTGSQIPGMPPKIDLATQTTGALLSSASTTSGTTYTLALTNSGGIIETTNAAAVTVTVPTNASVAFPVGSIVELFQYGTGQLIVSPAGGVTVRAPAGLRTARQYSTLRLRKRATDEWVLSGDATGSGYAATTMHHSATLTATAQ